MEKQRAYRSVEFCAYESLWTRDLRRGFSPIFMTAAIAMVVLLMVVGFDVAQSVQAKNPPAIASPAGAATDDPPTENVQTLSSATTDDASSSTESVVSSDPISQLDPEVSTQLESAYVQLQQAGDYSTSTADAVGASLVPYVTAAISYPTSSAADIQTDSDTSYARMLQYRSDLRTSLAPLLQNTEPEYEIFAYYVETGDASYLTKLEAVADEYREAASSTALVVVPVDAVQYHVAILNAMEEFAGTLDEMVAHANDPIASAALLENYDQAQSDMLTSFNDLTNYYKSKTPPTTGT